ncbi:MAG: transketolase C-terminal domain-containing protein [Oligoflexia bacterium]|nr:transketolase C-terminal domain-containing protein [Oligoflexia bacterium]
MRNALSDLITESASNDPNSIVLSGDHGYALFDAIRKKHPNQFLNVGVMEQAMIGIAAGLCKQGFRPTVYGLSAFVPIRVLEQIKLDVCYPCLPVTFIGDGAGLVYSTLGVSHQCAEDVAALRALPNLRIYSPCDAEELRAVYRDMRGFSGPSYIRIGKGDRPVVNAAPLESGVEPHYTVAGKAGACLVATGSMVSISTQMGRELGLSVLSVPKLKPLSDRIVAELSRFQEIIVLEEHSRHGGLASALAELLCELPHGRAPRLRAITLKEKFAEKCGTYQYALSEHEMADHQIKGRISQLLGL